MPLQNAIRIRHWQIPLANAIAKFHAKFFGGFHRQKPLENAGGKCHVKCHWKMPLQNSIAKFHWKIASENAIGKRH